MNKIDIYKDLIEKHQDEMNNFPMAFAFSEFQLSEALTKLGATDISEVCTVMNAGDVMLKTDVPKFLEMNKRHREELRALFKDKELAEVIFEYEMDNHEYAINWEGDSDVLNSVCLSTADISEMGLEHAYRAAKEKHMIRAHEEWHII